MHCSARLPPGGGGRAARSRYHTAGALWLVVFLSCGHASISLVAPLPPSAAGRLQRAAAAMVLRRHTWWVWCGRVFVCGRVRMACPRAPTHARVLKGVRLISRLRSSGPAVRSPNPGAGRCMSRD